MSFDLVAREKRNLCIVEVANILTKNKIWDINMKLIQSAVIKYVWFIQAGLFKRAAKIKYFQTDGDTFNRKIE